MLKLINPALTPVGGFRYVDPDNGFRFEREYSTFSDLEKHVQEYRSQNKLVTIENFREVWENWVCQEPNTEKICCPVSKVVARKFHHYVNAGKILVSAALKKVSARFVRQEIADARAKTCLNCRSNVYRIGHKHAGFYAERWASAQASGRSTQYGDRLFTCQVCTCILKAKVHYKSSDIKKSLSSLEIARLKTEPKSIDGKPLKCWQLEAVEKINRGESDDGEGEEEKGTGEKEG